MSIYSLKNRLSGHCKSANRVEL